MCSPVQSGSTELIETQMVPTLNPTPVRVLRSRVAVPVPGDQAVTLFPLTPSQGLARDLPALQTLPGPERPGRATAGAFLRQGRACSPIPPVLQQARAPACLPA